MTRAKRGGRLSIVFRTASSYTPGRPRLHEWAAQASLSLCRRAGPGDSVVTAPNRWRWAGGGAVQIYPWAGVGAALAPGVYTTTVAQFDALHETPHAGAAVGYTFLTTAAPIR